MHHQDLPYLRFGVLLIAAIALGVALLQVVPARPAAQVASAAPGDQAATPAVVDAPAGQLVAEQPGGSLPTGGSGPDGAPPPAPEPVADPAPRRRGGVACAQPHRVARIGRDVPVHAAPGGRRIGSVPARSIYLDQPTFAWVQDTTPDGRWGRITVPWTKPVDRAGWVRMDALDQSRTTTMVVADLSERRVTVYQRCRPVLQVRSAIGRPGSPSPTGRFWVTDRVQVPGAQRASFGSFAFGLSTVQPRLPRGWTGGNQMAIHGTGAPGSIGAAASAGCLRVSEDALRRLKPLLRLGTPVVIQP